VGHGQHIYEYDFRISIFIFKDFMLVVVLILGLSSLKNKFLLRQLYLPLAPSSRRALSRRERLGLCNRARES
jgi:hypothetical protein